MRFLLVEDEYYARKALRQSVLLWQKHAAVAEADNGVTALAMLEQSSFDVVLLDIRMPQMDGLTLAEHISRLSGDTYMIMITGYSEFEYAQKAIHTGVREYLLKPVDDDKLCDALTRAQEYWEKLRKYHTQEQTLQNDGRNMRRLLEQTRLRQWLGGQDVEAEQDLEYPWCMVFRIFGFSVPAKQVEQALQTRLQALEGVRYDLFSVKADDLCVLIRYLGQGPDRHARLQMLSALREDMRLDGMETRMAMSGLNAIADAPHAYAQAQTAQNFRLLRNEPVICYGCIKEQVVYVVKPGPAELSDFALALSMGQEKQASALARQAVQAVLNTKNASLASLQDALNRLCACMNCAIAQTVTNGDAMEAELLQLGIRTEDFQTPQALIKRLDMLITKVCALNERVSISNADQVVAFLKQYVQEHYGENVALKELAESRIYLNPSYLSRLFKAKTGTSFKNYLTQVRMDHALRMLALRERSVMSIAGECGYGDASQFIHLFRKHYGMTPSVFRETKAEYKEEIWLEKEQEDRA